MRTHTHTHKQRNSVYSLEAGELGTVELESWVVGGAGGCVVDAFTDSTYTKRLHTSFTLQYAFPYMLILGFVHWCLA